MKKELLKRVKKKVPEAYDEFEYLNGSFLGDIIYQDLLRPDKLGGKDIVRKTARRDLRKAAAILQSRHS